MVRYGLPQLLLCLAAYGQAPSLTLRVANEPVSAGGWAQIKVYADSPALIAKGNLALDLDPQVFGPIESVSAFSPAGDAMGLALINGSHVDVSLRSPSGGLGQLPGVPVLTVRAPVLPNAQHSGFVSLSFTSRPPIGPTPEAYGLEAPWADPAGNAYDTVLVSGQVQLGAEASIENVTPGGGFQIAGTVLRIDGTGFSSSTRVSADGLALSSVNVVSPTRIDATLASSVELTGVRFRISGSSSSGFFSAFPSAVVPIDPAQPGLFAIPHVIFPITEQKSAEFTQRGGGSLLGMLVNPSASPMEIRLLDRMFEFPARSWRFTLAPGAVVSLPRPTGSTRRVDSDAPFRAVEFYENIGARGVRAAAASGGPVPIFQLMASDVDVKVEHQAGAVAPDPRVVRLYRWDGAPQESTIQVATGNWLTVTPLGSSSSLTLSFNTSGLAPGNYTGTIVATPVLPETLRDFLPGSVTIRVTLNVSEQPTITVTPIRLDSVAGTTSSDITGFVVRSNGTAAIFATRTTTEDGGNWLSVDTPTGSSTVTVKVNANPAGLPGGIYRGTVFVQGPRNTVEVPVGLYVYPFPKSPMQAEPASINFIREIGSTGTFSNSIANFTNKAGPILVSVRADNPGNWLTVNTFDGGLSAQVQVAVDVSAIPSGTYHATITGTAGGETAQISVILAVYPKPVSALTINPPSLVFNTPAGVSSPVQNVTVQSRDGAVLYRLSTGADSPINSNVEFNPASGGQLLAPGTIGLYAVSKPPGTYRTNMTFTTTAGTVSIPVVTYITASPDKPPVLASIVNAASHTPGPIAPGEIITLRGMGIGPAATGLRLDQAGRIQADVGPDTKVWINGIPAPILYASPEQWNVVVPYELEGSATTSVKVLVNGLESKTWTVPVAAAAPGVFTIGSTGVGRGAVLNQDNTVNSTTNFAPAGTVIQIFATGAGQSVPASLTGSVSPLAGSGRTRLPVKVFLSGTEANVVFAGPAPGFASGALQVNAVVPALANPNVVKTATLVLEVDGIRSAPVEVTIK